MLEAQACLEPEVPDRVTQWERFFLQKAYHKFKTGSLEHGDLSNGLLQWRRAVRSYRCPTKTARAGFVRPCLYALHIWGMFFLWKGTF